MGMIICAPSMGGGTTLDLSFITATSDKILEGYIGSDIEGNPVEGSMVDNGAKTASLNAGGNYIISAGYHNGNGKVTANSLSSQTIATATADDILVGETAWVNGVKLVGSMIDYSDQVIPRDGDTSHIKGIENYWETSTGKGSDIVIDIPQTGRFKNTKITQAIYGVHPDLIKYDAVIGSNPINENGYHIKGNFTGDGTATSSKILEGFIAYAKGNRLRGIIKTMNGMQIEPGPEDQIIPCGNKYMNYDILVKGCDTVEKIMERGWAVLPFTIRYNINISRCIGGCIHMKTEVLDGGAISQYDMIIGLNKNDTTTSYFIDSRHKLSVRINNGIIDLSVKGLSNNPTAMVRANILDGYIIGAKK